MAQQGNAVLGKEIDDEKPVSIKRHTATVRIWHWTVVLAVGLLIWTGVMILNIHPRFYWGDSGHKGMPAVMAVEGGDLAQSPLIVTGVLGKHQIDLSGRIGHVWDVGSAGKYFLLFAVPDDFQYGKTRAIHFMAAEILIAAWLFYLFYLAFSGHFQEWRIRFYEFRPKMLFAELKRHLRIPRPGKMALPNYNLLQKLAYLGLFYGLMPLIILTGLTMSNAITARFPVLIDIFGGRQSARTLHFIAASLFVTFIIVHLLALVAAGPINYTRSIITGRFRPARERSVKP